MVPQSADPQSWHEFHTTLSCDMYCLLCTNAPCTGVQNAAALHVLCVLLHHTLQFIQDVAVSRCQGLDAHSQGIGSIWIMDGGERMYAGVLTSEDSN